jgi:hypothetical protein
MKIIAVIVDELPNSCLNCNFCQRTYLGNYACAGINDFVDEYLILKKRHPDCPLKVVEKEESEE